MNLKTLRKKTIDRNLYSALALWARDCAMFVLPYFEKKYPKDKRPRNALKELRKWMRTGRFSMTVIRKASLDAHAAARNANDEAARFAARSAGHALAVAHVPTHAFGAYYYAVKAVKAAAIKDKRKRKLGPAPKNLRKMIKLLLPRRFITGSH